MIQPQVYGMGSRLEDISVKVLLHYEVLHSTYVSKYISYTVEKIINLEMSRVNISVDTQGLY